MMLPDERRNNTAERLLQNPTPILAMVWLATFQEIGVRGVRGQTTIIAVKLLAGALRWAPAGLLYPWSHACLTSTRSI
ncbi:MAG: hypothetical protein ACREX4_15735 [Gammaproteobacteria bacterium]